MPTRKQSPRKSGSEEVVEVVRPSDSAVEPQHQPALSRFIEAVRKAVNAALDLADAAADAVTKAVRKGA